MSLVDLAKPGQAFQSLALRASKIVLKVISWTSDFCWEHSEFYFLDWPRQLCLKSSCKAEKAGKKCERSRARIKCKAKYFKKCYTVITFLVFIAISLPAPATFIFLVLIGSFDSLPVIDFPEKFLWFQFYDSRLNTTLNCQCFCYQVLSVTLNRVGSRTGRSS